MKHTIELCNQFHHTTVNTRLALGYNTVSRRTERRWRRALCGVSGCQCTIRGYATDTTDGELFPVSVQIHVNGDDSVSVFVD